MVNLDILITCGHVVDYGMFVGAGDKMTNDAFAKEGFTEAALLTRWLGHATYAGKDVIAIGIILLFVGFGMSAGPSGMGWEFPAPIGGVCDSREVSIDVVLWVAIGGRCGKLEILANVCIFYSSYLHL